MKALKDEEPDAKFQELRVEKTRLTEAFLSGRIPQDVYRKTVIRIEKKIGDMSEEIRRRVVRK